MPVSWRELDRSMQTLPRNPKEAAMVLNKALDATRIHIPDVERAAGASLTCPGRALVRARCSICPFFLLFSYSAQASI